MTSARRLHLLAALRRITSAEELDGFRAELRRSGEAQDAELFRAMQAKADTFRRTP